MTSIINGAHQKGTRVVLTISVFAWTSEPGRPGRAARQPDARLNLAQQAAAAVRARGADGINLDFEPIASGYAEEFTALVRTVRAELDKQAPGYQLTFDTTGYIGNYPLEADRAGRRRRDLHHGLRLPHGRRAYAGSIAPLSGPAYDLEDTINAYAARVSPSKLILGMPWYGRAWSTVSDQVNAEDPERDEVRLVEHGHPRHRARLREAVRPALGQPSSSRPGSPTARRTAPRRTAA